MIRGLENNIFQKVEVNAQFDTKKRKTTEKYELQFRYVKHHQKKKGNKDLSISYWTRQVVLN